MLALKNSRKNHVFHFEDIGLRVSRAEFFLSTRELIVYRVAGASKVKLEQCVRRRWNAVN